MADLAARLTRANLAKALAILLLFLLGACSYMFEVRIDGKDSLSPIFELKRPLLTRQYVIQSVPLGSFSVYPMVEEKWDYKNPMWFFGLEPGRSKEVSHIQ